MQKHLFDKISITLGILLIAFRLITSAVETVLLAIKFNTGFWQIPIISIALVFLLGVSLLILLKSPRKSLRLASATVIYTSVLITIIAYTIRIFTERNLYEFFPLYVEQASLLILGSLVFLIAHFYLKRKGTDFIAQDKSIVQNKKERKSWWELSATLTIIPSIVIYPRSWWFFGFFALLYVIFTTWRIVQRHHFRAKIARALQIGTLFICLDAYFVSLTLAEGGIGAAWSLVFFLAMGVPAILILSLIIGIIWGLLDRKKPSEQS